MTLVVARLNKDKIAIAADTMVTEHGQALSVAKGVIKSCILPGNLCASFCNSPELAKRDFAEYVMSFAPDGARFSDAIKFFEVASHKSGNDYLLAFGKLRKIVAIRNGLKQPSIARTQWIGDHDAFKRFVQLENNRSSMYTHKRAIPMVYMADEPSGSPASDLYSNMRSLIQESSFIGVGGLVSLVSFREVGFRFSVYSDVLFDWPFDPNKDLEFTYATKTHLSVSGENTEVSISQISPTYYNMNTVAFYFLKGKLAYLFTSDDDGLADKCILIRKVEPGDIAAAINQSLCFDVQPLLTVMSSAVGARPTNINESDGLSMSLFCEANSFPKKSAAEVSILHWKLRYPSSS